MFYCTKSDKTGILGSSSCLVCCRCHSANRAHGARLCSVRRSVFFGRREDVEVNVCGRVVREGDLAARTPPSGGVDGETDVRGWQVVLAVRARRRGLEAEVGVSRQVAPAGDGADRAHDRTGRWAHEEDRSLV